MAQYTLDGNEKEIAVIGIYASIKNNSDNVMYASASAGIDISSENVTPIQTGESAVIAANNDKKVYVMGTGDIAILSGNEKFNFFKPAPKGGSGGGGGGITEQQLNDALKPYATTVSVNNKLEAYATSESVTKGLSGKVDVIEGMGLSENSFTNDEKTKLSILSETALSPTVYVENNSNELTYTKLIEFPYSTTKRRRNSWTFMYQKGNVDGIDFEYGTISIRVDINVRGQKYANAQIFVMSQLSNYASFVLGVSENTAALFISWASQWDYVRLTQLVTYSDNIENVTIISDPTFEKEFPVGYTQQEALVFRPEAELADLKSYIGYTDSDIYGLEVDFENNKSTRLAGAVGKTAGADFDSVNAFGGRRRCNLSDSGEVLAYYGESEYVEDGTNGQVMVEQPRFYYKIVPLKTEKIDGTEGYHLRKARYYISDTPKAGFKVHPAFAQNGVEVDKIYLSAYEGCIYDTSASSYLLADEQIADFNTDKLSAVANTKPASGVSQNLNIANSRRLAQNRGNGWGITSIQTLSVTQLLFAIEYATFNSQNAIGMGISVKPTGTDNSSENTGLTSALGNASGQVASGAISYRGEENIWGNIMHAVDGCTVAYGNSDFISINIGEQTDIRIKAQAGYISAFYYDPITDWAFLPSETSGTSAVPIGDQLYITSNRNFYASFYAGGDWYHGNATGLYMTYLIWTLGANHMQGGARLIYIPQKSETTPEVAAE